MGFWSKVGKVVEKAAEKAPEVAYKLQQESAKREASLRREAMKKINENEKKLQEYEQSGRMKDPEFARKVKVQREKIEKAKSTYSPSNHEEKKYGGKTVAQWNSGWIYLGRLSSLTLDQLSAYNKSIGLYKGEKNGKIVYIGRAIEHSNGGFRKRLRDYVRDSDSGRTHGSGQKMNENADDISISILVVGNSQEDVKTVKELEKAMIRYGKPGFNVQHR